VISASLGFQPDRGLGGFQLAEDGGFQTRGPVCALDLRVVVSFSAQATGPARPPSSGGGAIWAIPRPLTRPRRAPLDLRVTLACAAPGIFSTALERDDEELLLLLAATGPAAGRAHALWLALIEEDDGRLEAERHARRVDADGRERLTP